MKCKHNWVENHPEDNECLICIYKDWHDKIIELRPDWGSVEFEKYTDSHNLGDLPKPMTIGESG